MYIVEQWENGQQMRVSNSTRIRVYRVDEDGWMTILCGVSDYVEDS